MPCTVWHVKSAILMLHMKSITRAIFGLTAAGLLTSNLSAGQWVTYEGREGPGNGKHIVLISGDEEYRSEESFPMLGKILSQRHGYRCTVLFSQDKNTGEINPDEQTNIPGMHLVDDADLLILGLRFRELPDKDMKHFVDYITAGKPFIALRTSTHAFNYTRDKSSPYAMYSFDNKDYRGGFGMQLLGETWWTHHGHHKKESARGLIDGENMKHPILKGVKDIWGDSDVYGVRDLPADATVLVWGLTLSGMKPDSLPNYDKSIMPITWLLDYQVPGGQTGGALTSTIGAATDLENEGLRRLVVNAAYYFTGLEDKINGEANVDYIGEYKPSNFSFGGYKKGVKPSDHELKD